MKLQVFYTSNVLDPRNVAIMSTTGGRYAHVGLVFTLSEVELGAIYHLLPAGFLEDLRAFDDGLYRIYFESISTKDKRTGKTGVRGPYDFHRVIAWQNKGWNRLLFGRRRNARRLEIQDVPALPAERVPGILEECFQDVIRIRYAYLQILFNWRSARLGTAPRRRSRSRTKWTCVEFVVQKLRSIAIRWYDLGYTLFDEYVPSGHRGPGVYEMGRDQVREYRKRDKPAMV